MSSKTKPVRNGQIEFWRFIGIMMIVIGHSNKLVSNPPLEDVFALWVDFFFIITGFFMASSIARMNTPCEANTLGSETITYTLKKIKGFYLFFIFASLAAIGAKVILHGFEEVFINWKIFGSINDFLMIYTTGLPSFKTTVGEWYLSAMVLAVLIIYPLARKFPNMFKNVIAFLLGVFLYGIMLHNEGALTDPGTWYDIGMKGFVRAVAGISLGFVANTLTESIKRSGVFETKIGIAAITVVDIFAIPFAVLLMVKGINPKYSSAVIFFLFAGVVTSLTGKSLFTKAFSNRFCAFLGKLSLPIFLCQGPIIYLLKHWQNCNPDFEAYCNTTEGLPVMLAMLAVGTIILALICLFVCNFLTKRIDAWWLKLKEKGENLRQKPPQNAV